MATPTTPSSRTTRDMKLEVVLRARKQAGEERPA
jgi:hypothetical protein